jgi:putative endonuclease
MAQSFLRCQGYDILDSNWRSRGGELDIVCAKKDLIVFVEVKTRTDVRYGLPGEALTEKKQRRLLHAASAYLSKNKLWERSCRIDLISVRWQELECQIEHVHNVIEFSPAVGGRHSHWQPW